MPKRTFWLATGAVVGAGSSLWAERRIRKAVEATAARLQPDALVAEVGRSARNAANSVGSRVKGALTEGRTEMQLREQQLWEELAGRGVNGSHDHPAIETEPVAVSDAGAISAGSVTDSAERRLRRNRRLRRSTPHQRNSDRTGPESMVKSTSSTATSDN